MQITVKEIKANCKKKKKYIYQLKNPETEEKLMRIQTLRKCGKKKMFENYNNY